NFIKTSSKNVLALINDEVIYFSDFQEQTKQFGSKLSKEDKRLLLQEMIDKKILKIYAEENNFFEDPKIRESFDWQKNEMKTELLLKIMFEEKSKQNVHISDENYKEYINENSLIKVMIIFIPMEDNDTTKVKKKIYKAYDKLESGAEFETVRKRFMDKIYRGPYSEPEIVKYTALKRMFPKDSIDLSVGEYTKPIASSYGYYIIKRYEDPEFNEMKEHIENEVRSQKEGVFFAEYIDEFKSGITYYDINIKEFLLSDESFPQNEIIIATYNNYQINKETVKKYFDRFLTKEQIDKMELKDIEDIAKQIALQEFLRDTAIEEQYDTTSSFITQWKVQKQEFENKWDDFIISEVFKNVVSPEIKVSDEEIIDYYQINQDEFDKDGKLKPLSEVRYEINVKLVKEKQKRWFEKVKQDYNIEIEKYEKYL
ncbi:MAG: peptidylprolyl isomerase, partial [Candidatus Cloacimonetes bacterium]|nr:peptidylprolyl isomerase [Candidatus Cloacimonadota bacterium]